MYSLYRRELLAEKKIMADLGWKIKLGKNEEELNEDSLIDHSSATVSCHHPGCHKVGAIKHFC